MEKDAIPPADHALLSNLLNSGDTLQTTEAPRATQPRTERPTEAPRREARAERPPKQKPRERPQWATGLYDKIGTTLALTSVLAISALLWWVGAFFSLRALAGWGVRLAQLGGLQWLIPVAITAAELWLWPAGRRVRPLLALWVVVVVFDVGTTVAGLLTVLAGRHLPLFAGYDLPTSGPVLMGIAVAIGLLCAFGPERFGRGAAQALHELWD